jgi:hypothetical protein
VSLESAARDTIWIGPSSSLTVGHRVSDATTPELTPLVIVDPRGDLFLDFRRTASLEIVVGTNRVWARNGAFRLKDGLAVVSAGEIRVANRPAGPIRLGRAGDSLLIR